MDVPMCGVHNGVFKRGNEVCVFGAQPTVTNKMEYQVTSGIPGQIECDCCDGSLADIGACACDMEGGCSVDCKYNNQEEKEELEVDDTSFIYHFLMEKNEGAVVTMPRIITNIPQESERVRYQTSVVTKRPTDGLLALNTGTWDFHFLHWQLVMRGLKFRIMVLPNKAPAGTGTGGMQDLDPEVIMKYHSRSTFSYANDAHTFFIRIEGAEWGLAPMGLIDCDVPKLAKRFAEICRLSEFGYYKQISDIKMVARVPIGDVEFYDGMNYVSLKFALKLTKLIADEKRRNRVRRDLIAGHISRFNIRVLTPLGLIKGDCIVVDGLAYDIVYHPENLKSELKTDGWCLATMTRHNPYHIAVWDTQTWVNNRNVLPLAKQIKDLDNTIQDLVDSFNAGEVPDWLMLGEELHDDSGLPDYERLSQLMDKQYIRWQAHGFDIRAAQNLVFMATNGLIKRMERNLKTKPIRYYKKTWTRMSNAFLAGVITRESLIHMGNVDMKGTSPYLYHDMRYGLVMNGARFRDTYSLHGGWDLDDTVKVILIKIWSSDPNRTRMMLESGALDPRCPVRNNQEEATPVAFLVRSPNGPGEYSIEALDPENWMDMPWHAFDEELIPVIDLVNIPDPQTELVKGITITGIPTSLVHTGKPITREQGLEMIEAQRYNPGIGAICNCLMNWVMTMGTSFPPRMLALLEQMVDTTQQLRDPVSFQAITEEVNNLYQQMVDQVVAGDLRVDGLLAIAHPIPEEFAEQMRSYMVPGRFSRFNNYFGFKVDYLKKEVLLKSMQMRHPLPLVNWTRALNVSNESKAWAKNFNWRYNAELKMNQTIWTHRDEEKNPFARMHFEMMRSAANKATVAKAVAELREFGGNTTYKKVLALWNHIVSVSPGHPYGVHDRVIFQPGEDESVMHVLIEALNWMGQGNGFIVPDAEEE